MRKPRYRNITEDIDFFELFRRVESRFDNCFLLESLGEDGERARTHVMGFDPCMLVYATGINELVVTDTATGNGSIAVNGRSKGERGGETRLVVYGHRTRKSLAEGRRLRETKRLIKGEFHVAYVTNVFMTAAGLPLQRLHVLKG